MLYLNGLVVFPTFFNLSLNLAIRSSWSEPQSAPCLVFADCIELLHLWLQRIYQSDFVLTIWWCPCVELSLVLLEDGVYTSQSKIIEVKCLAICGIQWIPININIVIINTMFFLFSPLVSLIEIPKLSNNHWES